MRNLGIGALAALLISAASSGASAAIITQRFDFTATNFQALGAGAPPVNTVIGAVTITYDTEAEVNFVTSGITLNALNIALDSPLTYSYLPSFGGGLMRITGFEGLHGVGWGTNDFALNVPNVTGTGYPNLPQFIYAKSGINGAFAADRTMVTISAVPEPMTWGLMIGGFGLAGVALRRGRANAHALKPA